MEGTRPGAAGFRSIPNQPRAIRRHRSRAVSLFAFAASSSASAALRLNSSSFIRTPGPGLNRTRRDLSCVKWPQPAKRAAGSTAHRIATTSQV